jgi:beta-hydroxylase
MMQETEIKNPDINARRKKHHRPSVAMGLWIIKRIENFLMRYSNFDDRPFYDPALFDWVAGLENGWMKIREELEQVLEKPEAIPNFQDISPDQSNITRDDKWKTFFLYGYGYKMDSNCNKCPETTRIVEAIPGMMTAFFSVLSPGKHIPPHRGPYKGLLRCHLALKVPEPGENCWIQVDEQVEHWTEGKCLVFDDTYSHMVQNDTEGTRVVLFIDIVRPLRFPGSLVNKMIIRLIRLSPFIQDAIKNQRAWEYRLGTGD